MMTSKHQVDGFYGGLRHSFVFYRQIVCKINAIDENKSNVRNCIIYSDLLFFVLLKHKHESWTLFGLCITFNSPVRSMVLFTKNQDKKKQKQTHKFITLQIHDLRWRSIYVLLHIASKYSRYSYDFVYVP